MARIKNRASPADPPHTRNAAVRGMGFMPINLTPKKFSLLDNIQNLVIIIFMKKNPKKVLRLPTKRERMALGTIIRFASGAIELIMDDEETPPGYNSKKTLLRYHGICRRFIADQYDYSSYRDPDFYKYEEAPETEGALKSGEFFPS